MHDVQHAASIVVKLRASSYEVGCKVINTCLIDAPCLPTMPPLRHFCLQRQLVAQFPKIMNFVTKGMNLRAIRRSYSGAQGTLKVAVIGGGLAGSSCANTLSKLDVEVSVFDMGFRGPGGSRVLSFAFYSSLACLGLMVK